LQCYSPFFAQDFTRNIFEISHWEGFWAWEAAGEGDYVWLPGDFEKFSDFGALHVQGVF